MLTLCLATLELQSGILSAPKLESWQTLRRTVCSNSEKAAALPITFSTFHLRDASCALGTVMLHTETETRITRRASNSIPAFNISLTTWLPWKDTKTYNSLAQLCLVQLLLTSDCGLCQACLPPFLARIAQLPRIVAQSARQCPTNKPWQVRAWSQEFCYVTDTNFTFFSNKSVYILYFLYCDDLWNAFPSKEVLWRAQLRSSPPWGLIGIMCNPFLSLKDLKDFQAKYLTLKFDFQLCPVRCVVQCISTSNK